MTRPQPWDGIPTRQRVLAMVAAVFVAAGLYGLLVFLLISAVPS